MNYIIEKWTANGLSAELFWFALLSLILLVAIEAVEYVNKMLVKKSLKLECLKLEGRIPTYKNME